MRITGHRHLELIAPCSEQARNTGFQINRPGSASCLPSRIIPNVKRTHGVQGDPMSQDAGAEADTLVSHAGRPESGPGPEIHYIKLS